MNRFRSLFRSSIGLIFAVLVAMLAGCGSGDPDPAPGTPDVGVTPAPETGIAPTITATLPLARTPVVAGVATNSAVFATFSKPMAPATLTPKSFTLSCPADAPIAASVAYDAGAQTATLTPEAGLPPNTLCTATITTAAKDLDGNPLASSHVWAFTTTALADTTRPGVILTGPAPGASDVSTNTSVTATFSEDMDPSTLSGTSFVVTNTALAAPVGGTVSYSVAARTATFMPSMGTLVDNSPFIATITTAATDLAGNALTGNTGPLPDASDYEWTFITGAAADVTAPTVTAIDPSDGTIGICRTKTISATFSEPMNADSINEATFHVVDGSGDPVVGTVSYDPQSRIASFVRSAPRYAPDLRFVVTIESGSDGVKDAAGTALANSKTWGFTPGPQPCSTVVDLGTASSFAAFGGGAGVTNQVINTRVYGNLGTTAACTLITGFHDAANVYTETPLNIGAVNGSIYCGPPAPGTTTTLDIATQARADALTAYNELAAKPAGSDPTARQLQENPPGYLYFSLPPGVYTTVGTLDITAANLHLEGGNDPNATWVFQSAGLAVGQQRIVRLLQGAQSKNVFWQVGGSASLGQGSQMIGTIIAKDGITISMPDPMYGLTTLFGRALSIDGSVTMFGSYINTTSFP